MLSCDKCGTATHRARALAVGIGVSFSTSLSDWACRDAGVTKHDVRGGSPPRPGSARPRSPGRLVPEVGDLDPHENLSSPRRSGTYVRDPANPSDPGKETDNLPRQSSPARNMVQGAPNISPGTQFFFPTLSIDRVLTLRPKEPGNGSQPGRFPRDPRAMPASPGGSPGTPRQAMQL